MEFSYLPVYYAQYSTISTSSICYVVLEIIKILQIVNLRSIKWIIVMQGNSRKVFRRFSLSCCCVFFMHFRPFPNKKINWPLSSRMEGGSRTFLCVSSLNNNNNCQNFRISRIMILPLILLGTGKVTDTDEITYVGQKH